MSKIRVVHYINQFFANIGGEEKADYPAELRVGEVVGPGLALAQKFLTSTRILKKLKLRFLRWLKDRMLICSSLALHSTQDVTELLAEQFAI